MDLIAQLINGTKRGFRRLSVDVGQTSFFEGREFRSFYELSIPSLSSKWLKFSSPVNFILHEQFVSVDDGWLKFSAFTSTGSELAPFTSILPVIGKNRMSERAQPFYEPQCTLTGGGSYNGGALVELVRLKTSNSTNAASTVGNSVGSERGLPAGDYYLQFENLGNGLLEGFYTISWEER